MSLSQVPSEQSAPSSGRRVNSNRSLVYVDDWYSWPSVHQNVVAISHSELLDVDNWFLITARCNEISEGVSILHPCTFIYKCAVEELITFKLRKPLNQSYMTWKAYVHPCEDHFAMNKKGLGVLLLSAVKCNISPQGKELRAWESLKKIAHFSNARHFDLCKANEMKVGQRKVDVITVSCHGGQLKARCRAERTRSSSANPSLSVLSSSAIHPVNRLYLCFSDEDKEKHSLICYLLSHSLPLILSRQRLPGLISNCDLTAWWKHWHSCTNTHSSVCRHTNGWKSKCVCAHAWKRWQQGPDLLGLINPWASPQDTWGTEEVEFCPS